MPTNRLPQPDQFGNFWVGTPPMGAVIFRSRYPGENGPKYFASTGENGPGVLLTEGSIRYFPSAQEAFKALSRLLP